jgi:hypothetical protein
MKKDTIKINILTPFHDETFMRQLPGNFKEEGFIFYENSQLDEIWDLVVVYEGLNDRRKIKCKQGGLTFISGEPPMSRRYSSRFLTQFDHLITSHPQIQHPNNHITQQALPWHFGLSYSTKQFNYAFDDLLKMQPPLKTKKISFITSNKQMMPGHKQRMKFLEAISKEFGNLIDIYGQGIKPIDDKAEALLSYQFNICVENSTINDYWTEKIADPILAFSIPLYHGCKNIDQYFNSNSLVRIDTKQIAQSLTTIDTILKSGDTIYSEKLPQLIIERNKLINEFNLFNVIKQFYFSNISNKKKSVNVNELRPSENFTDHQMKMNVLRLKRFAYRYF